jgi:siroheme decarboxylase
MPDTRRERAEFTPGGRFDAGSGSVADAIPLDALDRRIIEATQSGLPLVARPYHAVASRIGIEPGQLMNRLRRMLECGIIRRIGVVPNHYSLGYRANGMSVWDIPDARIREAGRTVGALPFVSHCYHRPRCLPDWPYNLFAMVHGKNRTEVESHVNEVGAVLGTDDRGHTVLFSTRILKKTGLRIARHDAEVSDRTGTAAQRDGV